MDDPLQHLIAAVTAAHRDTLMTLERLAEGIDSIDVDTPIPYALADDEADDFAPPSPAADPAALDTYLATVPGDDLTQQQRVEIIIDALLDRLQAIRQQPAAAAPEEV